MPSRPYGKSIDSDTLSRIKGKSASERFLHRLHCVALILGGVPTQGVARVFGDSARSLAYWVKRFEKGGVDELMEKSGRGRTSSLTPSQIKKVESFVKKNVETVTGRSLASFIESLGVALTVRQCWRILARLRNS